MKLERPITRMVAARDAKDSELVARSEPQW